MLLLSSLMMVVVVVVAVVVVVDGTTGCSGTILQQQLFKQSPTPLHLAAVAEPEQHREKPIITRSEAPHAQAVLRAVVVLVARGAVGGPRLGLKGSNGAHLAAELPRLGLEPAPPARLRVQVAAPACVPGRALGALRGARGTGSDEQARGADVARRGVGRVLERPSRARERR